ncbi:MAG: SH3 domain-containing protein [Thermodesulfobacteriota bacterium]
MKIKGHLRISLLLVLSSALIFACSQAFVQSQEETSESPSAPDSENNDTEEVNPAAPKSKLAKIPSENPLETIKDTSPSAPYHIKTQSPPPELDQLVKDELDKMREEIEALKKEVSLLKAKAPVPLSQQTQTPPSQAKVVWAFVNLREGPGTDHKVVGNVKRGTPLIILDEKRGWLHVQLEDGRKAWISKEAIVDAPKAPSPSSPPSKNVPPSPKPKSPM